MARGRLYRSNRDRVLGGVAGGMADYFDVDPTIIRLAWVIGAFCGFGIIAYIVAWIIMPEASTGGYRMDRSEDRGASADAEIRDTSSTNDRTAGEHDHEYRSAAGPWLLGLILVGVGLFLLVRNFVPFLLWIPFWPVLIILVGVLVLVGAFRRDPRERNDKR